ncbi:MAG: hypothetical protein QOJ74_2020 [Ilumatobacteraceae bacterium]|nr:hypothetical protein [Ilumatobacteraceae bacterium]
MSADGRRLGPMSVRLDQRGRLLIAAPLGLCAAAAASSFVPWQLSVLAGWDVAAAFIAGSVWLFVAVLDAPSTREVATREDDSRAFVDFIVVVACVVSLVGVVVGLAHARSHSGTFSSTLTAIAVFTVFLSWFTVHTLFALRYAHLYYTEPVGGIDFGGAQDLPDYMDFVYVAFTVGMTFQVSDTNIAARSIRRAIVRHSMLSYLFGTVVVGVAINVVGNLIR